MKCNIDQRGRKTRIIAGALIEAPGLFLVAMRFTGMVDGTWPWIVGVSLILAGQFMVLEGVLGWCAVRACGVKTPL
ncbi:MAG: hypothetical protein ACKPEA_03830 [Planctomycetota bacterium]